jgi:hypothetical protein
VNYWLALIFLFAGCSTVDRDFQNSLDSNKRVSTTVKVNAPEKLLEKFEVVETKPLEVSKIPSEPNKKDQIPLKKPNRFPSEKINSIKKSSPISMNQEITKPKLPPQYPEGLELLNSSAEKVWKNYKSNHVVDEKVFFNIRYMGMNVGKIMISNRGKSQVNGKEVWHFHSRFKSAPFYSRLYELDDTVDTYVNTDQFLTSRYSLIQRESKQDVDDLQLHDRDQLKTFWFYKQKKSDGNVRNKEKSHFIPYYSVDPFSVVFFFQGLPLKNGEVYEIPIINKAKILVLKSKVEGREKIVTELGEKAAIRIHATTKYSGETLKSGDLYFWFSDDPKRTLLKAQAKIKIGSVTADIVDEK